MAKRLTPEERQRRADEKARKKREREQAREARRRAKEEEKARKKREKEEKKRQKEIERGQKMKRKPRWLYWLAREQAAKKREHEQHLNAGRVALALGRAIRKLQKKIMDFVGPLIDHAAGLKTPEARMIWSQEPWSPQDRTRYNWGKRQELAELWKEFPDGVAEQDPKEAAADARRKTRARRIDHAKAIDKALDMVAAELREDEQNAVRSSLERGYEKVYADVLKELDDGRRAIDANRAGESRMADAKDYTKKGDPRRTSPETQIPQNMPRLGNYGESVKFGMPSPDQVKAVLNAEFEGKNYSERIWKDTDKLATELKEMMRAAIINGENSQVVARRLAQRMGVEYSHALRLVRTEQSRILNEAALASAKDAGADRYQFVAIEDGRTCHQCLRKNRRIYKMSEKKTGLNFPPLHPHCRCTIIARFAWEDDGDDEPTPTPTPTKPEKEPGYFERSPIQMSDSELKAVNNWLTNVETVSKPAADAVRENPTKANAQAAAKAQDAAMKAEEQRQQAAIGAQRRAIEAGKETAAKKKTKKTEAARAFEEAFKPIEAETPEGGTKSVPVENVIDEFFGVTRIDWTDPNLIKAYEAKGKAHTLRNSQKLAERTEIINAFFRDYVVPSGAYQSGEFDIKAVKAMGLTHKQAQLVEYFDTWFQDFDDDTIAAIYEASGGKEKKTRRNRSVFKDEQFTDDAPRKPKRKQNGKTETDKAALKRKDDESSEFERAKGIYDLIKTNRYTPILESYKTEFEKCNGMQEKAELTDRMLELVTGKKSNWNKKIVPITKEIEKQFKGFLCGAYLTKKQVLALRDDASMGTIIHELMHARSSAINDNEWNKSIDNIKNIEDNIEDALCELISYEIYKKLGIELGNDVAYVSQVAIMLQLYKIITKEQIDISDFVSEMYKRPNGKRCELIISLIKSKLLNETREKRIIEMFLKVFST